MYISIDCDPWTGGVSGAVKLLKTIQEKFNVNGDIKREMFGIATLDVESFDCNVEELIDHIKSLSPGSMRGAEWNLPR